MILFTEGFDNYGTTIGGAPAVTITKWTVESQQNTDIEQGRFGGYSIEMTSASNDWFSPSLQSGHNVMYANFAIQHRDTGFGDYFGFLNDTGSEQVNLSQSSIGKEISVYRASTLLGSSSGLNLRQAQWYQIEVKVVCDNVVGSVEVRVDGVVAILLTNIDTQNAANNTLGSVLLGSTNNTRRYDDIVIYNDLGSENNDFLGTVKVTSVTPAVDVRTDLVPDTGADNFARVNEAVADGDTSYVQGTQQGEMDAYQFPAPSGIQDDIRAVTLNTAWRETDATPYGLQSIAESGGSIVRGKLDGIGSTSYKNTLGIFETDPATQQAWLLDDLLAAQIGFQVQK